MSKKSRKETAFPCFCRGRNCFRGTIIFCLLLFTILAPPGNTAFEPVAIGARPAGLGGAYTALSDDVYGAYYNPAGLAFVPRSEFSAQYSRMYSGLWDKSSLGYSFAGFAQPLKFKDDYGTVGFSWLSFTADSLYKENSIVLSYGKDFAPRSNHIFSAGVNLKSLSLGYGNDPDGYTQNSVDNDGNATNSADGLFKNYGTNKSAFAIDLGMQVRPYQNYRVGISIINMNEPVISINPKDPAKLSRAVSLGLAHTGRNFSLALDYLTRQFNQFNDYRLSIAGEQYLPLGLGLRAGMVSGSRELTNIAVGAGFRTSSFQFDYALEYPMSGIKGTMGNHKVSLILRFGPVVRGAEYANEAIQKELEQAREKISLANAEIKRLKEQLDEILKQPASKIETMELKKTPVPGTTETVAETAPSPAVQTRKEYKDEYASYTKVADKLAFVDRLRKIKSIAEKFRGRTDTSEAEQEYKILLQEQKTQEKMYSDSMGYYEKMSLRGIDTKTKRDILERIISKYESFGINVSQAQEELNKAK